MSKNICAPVRENVYRCFTFPEVKKLVTIYNSNLSNKIKVSGKTKSQLMDELKKNLSCSLDDCLLDKQFVKSVINDGINTKLSLFKPPKPDGKYTWLSTVDINDIMKQYEQKFPEFTFFGAVPIDFNNFISEFSNFNLKRFSQNKKKLGVVFNLDPSNEPGIHWVALFLDLNDNTLCFFDSVGDKPVKEINNFIKKIISQGKEMNKTIKLIINNNEHQLKDSECGVYCLYFIINRLKGKSCNEINSKIIRDEQMNKYRDIFFR